MVCDSSLKKWYGGCSYLRVKVKAVLNSQLIAIISGSCSNYNSEDNF